MRYMLSDVLALFTGIDGHGYEHSFVMFRDGTCYCSCQNVDLTTVIATQIAPMN